SPRQWWRPRRGPWTRRWSSALLLLTRGLISAMIRISLTTALALSAGIATAATCPFNVPVATLPPHQVAGYSWGPVIQPMGDACVSSIVVDAVNDAEWYVGGINGLYMTKNGGQTGTHPPVGLVRALRLAA